MKIAHPIALAASVVALAVNGPAMASDKAPAAQTKYKQCVMFYSPRYKRTRIKPIPFDYRWCDKSDSGDCSKWKSDTLADSGHDFSIGAYCFTFHRPLTMEVRFSKTFKKGHDVAEAMFDPQMIRIKDNLEPHPLCATKAIHRFTIKRNRVAIRSGKPRQAKLPDCVWKPRKKANQPGA